MLTRSEKKRSLRILLLLVIVLLTGMSCAQRPTEPDARQALEEHRKAQFGTEVQVVSLHKTDGLAEEEDGAKYYTMEYEAEIVYPKGYEFFSLFHYKAGTHYKEDGRIKFLKTEKGWRPVDFSAWDKGLW